MPLFSHLRRVVLAGALLLGWGVASSGAHADTFHVSRTDDSTGSNCSTDNNDCILRGALIVSSTNPAIAACVASLPDVSQLGTNFIVNMTDDHDDSVCGVTDCTLREAINAANADGVDSTISFDSTVFGSSKQTIGLPSAGLPSFTSNITLIGPSSTGAGVTISGNGALQVDSGIVKVANLTLTSGDTGLNNVGGTVTVEGCTFFYEQIGIDNQSHLTAKNCTFAGNQAGIHSSDTLSLDSCTVTDNQVGIKVLGGSLDIANSIVGGGPFVDGIDNDGDNGPLGTVNDNGHNILTGSTQEIGLQPGQFGRPLLADNGGPTQTVALVGGSPAINAGATALTTDQRGKTRPYGDTADDIGAFEVQNNVPLIISLVVTPDPAYTNDTLTATLSVSDGDGDTLTHTYQWQKNGVAIDGATSSSLDLSKTGKGDKGDVLTCLVTVTDGKEAGTISRISNTITVQNSAPVVSGVIIDQSAPQTSDTLSFTIGTETDADGDTLTPTYQWKINGEDIAGATGATLDLSQVGNGGRGDNISVVVTVDDGSTSTSSESPQVTIQNTAPVIYDVAITPTDPLTNDILTANVSAGDADADTRNFTYVWKKNDAVISGETEETLDLSKQGNGDDGDSITVTVTANDDTLESNSFTSAPVTINNFLPVVDSVSPQGASDTVGANRTFTLTMSDGNGARDIREMWLLINKQLDWSSGATLIYRPSATSPTDGQLFLRRGDAFLPPITIGSGASSSDVLDNGAVRVVGSDVSVSVSGNTITLTLPVTVRDGWVGQNTLFARAQDTAGTVDPASLEGEFGFVREGTYTVTSQFTGATNNAPTLSKLTPGATYTTLNGSGIAPAAQKFGFFVKDEDGTSDIQEVWFLAGKQRGWAHSATFIYYPHTRRLVLRSDDGNSFLGGGQIGSAGIIENSQVKVDLSKVKVTILGNGKSFGLTLPLQAKSGLIGANKVWLRVQDNSGATSPGSDNLGFVQSGTWSVKAGTAAWPNAAPSNGNS